MSVSPPPSRRAGSARPGGARDRSNRFFRADRGAKADPETLVLRAAPGRVTRFRRGAIVAIAAAGSTAIIGVAWLALKPATLSLIARSDEKLVGAKAPPDALAGAPTSYGDVPKLGLPLPGDLGRPILERQRQLGGMVPLTPLPMR
ncbi:hypothetical protein [Hankyongella ginsenosidimutans]|uniref:hypothetical protein n=1 Tax=Hankyongella ginsenosidimutans TaxID=1763828 RepID=UPI001FE37A9E|nr:hypothetical protein [Hankyongella ginsenosidimutans]